MSASSVSSRTGLGRKAVMLVLGALVACVGAFAFASPAKADPFNTTLDNGQINLGFAFKEAKILPAPGEIAPGSPLPSLWPDGTTPTTMDPNTPAINVTGDLTGTNVSIPQNQFQPPIMIVENPLDGSPVPITLRATNDLTGTFDAASGELNLTAPLEARVLVGLGDSPPAFGDYCAVDLGNMAFTTNATSENVDFVGTAFTGGIEGNGAITGTFTVTADSVPHGGLSATDCADVNTVSKGKGSLWLSHGIATPADRPACPEGTEGLYPDCVEVKVPCPPGTVGDFEPNCVKQAARITNVKLNPARRAIKAGKRAVLRLRVVNKGNKAAVVNVNLRSRNKRVKVAKRVRIRVAPGKAAVKRINVKANRNARGRAVIIARGAGKQSKSVLKVKPLRKKGKRR